MLDTDVCIRVLRERPPAMRDRFNAEADAICISAVTLSELLHGAEKSVRPERARTEVERFADRLRVEPYGAEAARRYGAVRADLERRGLVIGAYDLLIAAHALALGVGVVTGNLREFGRVGGLRVADWLDGG